MIKHLLALTAAGICLMACASHKDLYAVRNRGEAEQLQDYCKRGALVDADTKRGDSLLTVANAQLKDSEIETARTDAELAALNFRLALAHRELSDVQGQVDNLNKALAKDKDQLQTYQQILEEKKSVRKP